MPWLRPHVSLAPTNSNQPSDKSAADSVTRPQDHRDAFVSEIVSGDGVSDAKVISGQVVGPLSDSHSLVYFVKDVARRWQSARLETGRAG